MRGVKEEWSRYKEEILEGTEELCGSRRIREGKKRKGSELCNGEIMG